MHKTLDKIDLSEITEVEFGVIRGGFAKLNSKRLKTLIPSLCLSIFVNSDSLDLLFKDSSELDQFCSGIFNIWKREIEEDNNLYF